MSKSSFAGGSELIGAIETDAREGLRLTIYSRGRSRKPLAVVVGSESYLLRALTTLGLAPPIVPLSEHWNGPRLAFVRSKPPNRASQNLR